jgi:hypothetical protein
VTKKVDPEAATCLHGQTDAGIQADPTSGPSAATNPDSQATPNAKDGKERAIESRKKRKQAARVRGQQPLWAALASTKVVLSKEMEINRAAQAAAESNATDVNNLGCAPFDSEPQNIWITFVGPTEISFQTSYFPKLQSDDEKCNVDDVSVNATLTVDKSRPFYVRVNKTDWATTRISKLGMDDRPATGLGDQWEGEIFGLAPGSSYECEFVDSAEGFIIYSTNVSTLPDPAVETGLPSTNTLHSNKEHLTESIGSTNAPGQTPLTPQSARPSSPTTTLRNSIATAESRLVEEKARVKRLRKEHKSQLNTTKKEVDSYNARLNSAGSGDDRQRKRVLQIKQHIRQADDAAAAIVKEVEGLGDIPEEDSIEWKAAKDAYEAEKSTHSSLRNGLSDTKSKASSHIHSLSAESNALQQKRERLQARQVKLKEQHDRITSANKQGLNEAQRRAAETAAKERERETREQNWQDQICALATAVETCHAKTQQVWMSVQAIETAFQQAQLLAQQQHMQGSLVLPDGVLPGSRPNPQPGLGYAYGAGIGTGSNPGSLHRDGGRGRSSSMLSTFSGLTDFSDQDALSSSKGARPTTEERKKSDGSVSISGSVGDPISPIGAERASPVGSKGKGSPMNG